MPISLTVTMVVFKYNAVSYVEQTEDCLTVTMVVFKSDGLLAMYDDWKV